jgi:perosamine synthetase
MNILASLTVDVNQSIRQALQSIDINARGIVFVTHNSKLVGVASDGDIRRALLRGQALDSAIKDSMNTNFISLPVAADDKLVRNTFSNKLKLIPLIDDEGNLVDVADAQRSHRIPLLEPDLTGRELEYITECVKTNWISSQGQYVRLFERAFSNMHAGMQALAVSNGTVALHLALFSLGIGHGDEVIVPDITFAASANSVLHCNALPVLCEINPETLCIDVSSIEELITAKTKAIMPVHLYGQPCDMDKLLEIARKYNLLVVEDCAEAIGSTWRGQPVGSFGDAATFSFFGNKTISTGEGGMILFKDQNIYEHAKILRDHGMTPGKRYWHDHVGFNYRLTNIQAAIGVAQMERLGPIVQKKIRISDIYTGILLNCPGVAWLPRVSSSSIHSNWLFTIVLDQGIDRGHVIRELLSYGIDSRPMFYPLHSMPPYKRLKRSASLAYASKLSRSGLSLPSSVSLQDDEIHYICKCLDYTLTELRK